MTLSGCVKVGPNFTPPSAEVNKQWREVDRAQVQAERIQDKTWWQVFQDPALNSLIRQAYAHNLSLRIAGVRVFETRAQLGIATGELFPQVQQGFGAVTYNRASERGPSAPQSSAGSAQGTGFEYWQADLGVTASWELDFWGKFRRAIESANDTFLGSIANYDAVLVSLTGDVASTYVLIRTLQRRIAIARANVKTQREGLDIARARYEGGATGERDVQQALTQLRSTEASIPQLQASLRQAEHNLSFLLGEPPNRLGDRLRGAPAIPVAPVQVAVGIPADLLRRRPDIRFAELQAASQCARIGVAKADLYPAFSLNGDFGFLASDVGRFDLGDLFSWRSRNASFGPSFQWNLFNYGRITNSVRVQDARFQEALENYRNTVLRAQQEVEDGLTGFLNAQKSVKSYQQAAKAAQRSADLALTQYREGATDYTTVLTAQQALLAQQDNLAVARGNIGQSLIAVYRALGGGWQIRDDHNFIPAKTQKTMQHRTNWGDMLQPIPVRSPAPQ